MGRQRWSDIYSKKFGQSHHDLCDAEEKYGFALKNLNDRAITRLPKSRQVWLTEVRKTTREYAVEAHQIGLIVSGGGSMWQTLNATILPDVEETIADCIVDKQVTSDKLKSIELDLSELDKVISQFKNEGPTRITEATRPWRWCRDPIIFVIGRCTQQRTHSVCHMTTFADDTSGVLLRHMQLNNGGATGDTAAYLNLRGVINEALGNVTDEVFHNLFPLVAMVKQ